MLDLEAKISDLNLTPSEKRLFGLSLGEAIAKFYKDETNLKAFQKEEENLKRRLSVLKLKEILEKRTKS